MAIHAEYTLRSLSVFEIFDLVLTIPTFEACCAKGLISGKNGEILYLVVTDAAAICAVAADKGVVSEQKEICIRFENDTAGVAAETV